MHALSLLALLLPLVKAKFYDECKCSSYNVGSDWEQNDVLTEYICTVNYRTAAQYDRITKRCVANPDWGTFDGGLWSEDCKAASVHGYFPIKNGKPDLWWAPITNTDAKSSC
ncbi:hypothetical protein E4U24_003556 [Claviceps purpurea]|nr:hypothetical protein E4U36_004722 [Claviceps purpurea]KAG6238641.1 hypothetical protein E4U25_001545 [Claviceps purpurea]KAG6246744.1 hypothetical protein E4U24_003556 [Claviceps purpurea]